MGRHPFFEIPCNVCSKPVDLTVDLYADECKKPVHEECYVRRFGKTESKPDTERTFSNTVSSLLFPYFI